MSPRRYDQRLRAQSSQETRERIVEALLDRLREAPAEPVSLDRVARTAGVSRSTVYVVFGSRAGLFEAAWATLMRRSGYDRLLEAVSAEDAREHLRGGIRAGVEMFAANHEVARALYAMARLDGGGDALGEAVQRMETERAAGMERVVGRLAGQGVLRPGLAERDAVQILRLLTSFDAFDQLFAVGRLSTEEVARLLVETAERTVCHPG
ncbi:MAG TPA: TetR/AcrR family transcriptional regulator [Solirubrobacteraceae bacterium]|nr:TetR/AcrR family transcriptional regulator [Solirubrobacteraceae bacterium]